MNNSKTDEYSDDFEIEDEFVCIICLDLMYQPTTTNCGHTFCKHCLKRAAQCPTCRAPFPAGTVELMRVNITLQKIIEKQYPEKIMKKQAVVQEEIKQEKEKENIISDMPVVICDSFLYPGMKTIMTVDTRQLKDMVHVVTRQNNGMMNSNNRKFIVMRKITDMRGVIMILKNVMQTSQVIAEVVGDQRIVIDSVYIPEERRGIYRNEEEALKFAKGRIIKDDDPYVQTIAERKAYRQREELDENDLLLCKQEHMEKIHASLREMKSLFSDEFNVRLHEGLNRQTIEAAFGQYPSVYAANLSAIDSLGEKLERETLYVLSHLELQNQNADLIYMQSGQERMNACVKELQKMKSAKHERLFVWEQDPSIKKQEANQTMLWILFALLLLYLGGKYEL